MSHSQYLRDLLRPLGIYDLEAPFNGGELDAQGEALDRAMAALEEIQRESSLTTAESWGLEQVARLFLRRPVATQPRPLADAFLGCGIPAKVEELGAAAVAVSFPGVAGEPPGFGELKRIIEDILPPHLDIQYHFWYLTWAELEDKFSCWRDIEDRDLTWSGLETCVI